MADTGGTRRRVAALLLACALPLAAGGCSTDPDDLVSGEAEPTATGNTAEENSALAADLAEQLADTIPGLTDIEVTYQDRLTLPATLIIRADIADPAAALAAVSVPVPDVPPYTDPEQTLAPVAAQLAQAAWLSEVDPMRSLSISLQDRANPEQGQSFDNGVSDPDIAGAFTDAFGPRPG